MFENVKFRLRAAKAFSLFKAAERAKSEGRDHLAFMLLSRALKEGRVALDIQSPRVKEKYRKAVVSFVSSGQELWQRELLAHFPGYRELLESVLKLQADMGLAVADIHPVDQMIHMIDIAKSRLNKSRKTLGIIYDNDWVPVPLREIMQLFLAGEITQEDAEWRLDGCAVELVQLRKWVPRRLPGEPLNT